VAGAHGEVTRARSDRSAVGGSAPNPAARPEIVGAAHGFVTVTVPRTVSLPTPEARLQRGPPECRSGHRGPEWQTEGRWYKGVVTWTWIPTTGGAGPPGRPLESPERHRGAARARVLLESFVRGKTSGMTERAEAG